VPTAGQLKPGAKFTVPAQTPEDVPMVSPEGAVRVGNWVSVTTTSNARVDVRPLTSVAIRN
jgi:hypothetical protein